MRRQEDKRNLRGLIRRYKDKRLDVRPDYQRNSVWSLQQKRLLIDSVLRDLDIPKIYVREINRDGFEEEVIDGQQRILAISEFASEEFALAHDMELIGAWDVRGKTYGKLDSRLKDKFDDYSLSTIIVREASDDEISEMFLRLQNGTTLNAAERRHAMAGKMKLFIREMVKHPFWGKVHFKNKRFAHDQVASQMMMVAIHGTIVNLRNKDIKIMYDNHRNFDFNSLSAKRYRYILNLLDEIFPLKTPELKKFNTISLFILIDYLDKNFVIKDKLSNIYDWFINFEAHRKEEESKEIGLQETEVVHYSERISHATDAIDSLKYRHETLLKSLFQYIPDIQPKDNKRVFTEEQKVAIFRKYDGICQLKIKCEGHKCEIDSWHADHKVPWSKGGKTTIENGLVSCPSCNLAKKDSILTEEKEEAGINGKN